MKMNRLMTKVFLLGLSLLVLSGCGKSIEKEVRRWENNQQTVERLKTSYPGYADLIAVEMDRAGTQWDSALQVSDEDEQVKALAQVNRFMNAGVIKDLLDIKSCLSSADRKMDQLLRMPKDSTEDTAASFAVKETQAAILKAKELLGSAPSDDRQALASLSSASAGLRSAESSLDKIIRTIRKNDQVSQKTAASSTQVQPTKTTATSTTQAKSTMWKCEYCGSQNLNSVTQCKSCGASR